MAFMAFDQNHGFCDFRVSVIIYCPQIYALSISFCEHRSCWVGHFMAWMQFQIPDIL